MITVKIKDKVKKFNNLVSQFSNLIYNMKNEVIEESKKIEGDFEITSNILSKINEIYSKLKDYTVETEEYVVSLSDKSGSKEDIKRLYNLTTKIHSISEKIELFQKEQIKFNSFSKKYENIESYISAFFYTIKDFMEQVSIAITEIEDNLSIVKDLEKINVKVLKVQEEERKKLSLEIHDGPAQAVANIVMQLEYVKKLYTKSPEKAKEEIDNLISFSKEILKGIRNYIFDLRPMTLDDFGISYTIKRFIENIKKLHKNKFDIIFTLNGDEDRRFRKEIEVSVFRIIQESVNNAIKHGKMSKIKIIISYLNDEMTGEITDDGEGFDLDEVMKNYSERLKYGMMSLVERAELVSGNLKVDSKIGHGTSILFKIPI